ncbi:MAG: guanine deaminase [Pseudomonadota bacterium]
MHPEPALRALRGAVLHCPDLPAGQVPDPANPVVEVIEDGLVLLDGASVAGTCSYARREAHVSADASIVDYRGCLLLPGFVDVHTHYPQIAMIGAYGEQLLDWLTRYTFPAEAAFADEDYARRMAEAFVRQLLLNGTTTAMVYGTVHAHSVDALFEAATPVGLQLVAGKVLMDRNCPEALRDTPESAYEESARLIERWHGKERFRYAVTPRFAPTSTPEQLAAAGRLLTDFDGVHLQTHLAENRAEVAWVAQLFPEARSYLDVYANAGLLGTRSVFGHCLHLDDTDQQVLHSHGCTLAFCPSSNAFLGSGIFDLTTAYAWRQKVALGSDVGAGTGFNLLRTLGDAYKAARLGQHLLTPECMLYMVTQAGARSLELESRVGSFDPGKDADVVVLDPEATELTALRTRDSDDPLDILFALTALSDERHVRAVYVRGQQVARL